MPPPVVPPAALQPPAALPPPAARRLGRASCHHIQPPPFTATTPATVFAAAPARRARLEAYIEQKYAETADWVRSNPLNDREPD